MPLPAFNQGEWSTAGSSVYSTLPQDVDHSRFKGFEHPEGDAGYLIAESIPHQPTRDLIAAAPKLYAALDAVVREYGKRGGAFDELLGPSEQTPEINAAMAALAAARGDK